MSDTTQSNRPLWHQNLTYGQVEAEAEKGYSKVVYNLHEDCLCLREELAALKAENNRLNDCAKRTLSTLQDADKNGLIVDTIWYSDVETLFDFIITESTDKEHGS